jgi:hypothetical protein
MSDDMELKKIHAASVPGAIAKAEHYRLLNTPAEAESICLDVLAVEPKHQKALGILVLALTDQLQMGRASVRRIRKFLERIDDEYLKLYYSGLLSEREGRACIHRELPGGFAYDCLRQAMEWYEKAEKLAPEGNDEAILRYNSCLRTIRRHHLEPRDDEGELPLE